MNHHKLFGKIETRPLGFAGHSGKFLKEYNSLEENIRIVRLASAAAKTATYERYPRPAHRNSAKLPSA